MRILIAGVLGGLAMFVWAAIAHTVLPLGGVGIKTIPEEAAVTSALASSLKGQSGLYMFPAAAMEGSAASGPSGLLIYSQGATEMTAGTLISEAVGEIVESLAVAFIVSLVALGYWGRVGVAALVGVAAVLSTNASYWIWYKFPTDFTLAAMFTDLVGYVVAGLVIAALVKGRAAAAPA